MSSILNFSCISVGFKRIMIALSGKIGFYFLQKVRKFFGFLYIFLHFQKGLIWPTFFPQTKSYWGIRKRRIRADPTVNSSKCTFKNVPKKSYWQKLCDYKIFRILHFFNFFYTKTWNQHKILHFLIHHSGLIVIFLLLLAIFAKFKYIC